MRLKTQRTYLLFLLISTFLFVDVVESIAFAPAFALLLFRGRQIPLFLRRIIASQSTSDIWNKLKSFIKKVVHFGEIANGLSEVEEFLEIFGYLNRSSSSNFTDKFTLNLQSAITNFQTNFNLNVTKMLDKNTSQVISQPRCGVPDIVNGTTTMNFDNIDSTTSFKPWWRTREKEKELTYAFHPLNKVTDGIVKSLFQDVFSRWSNVTSLNFTETTSFNDSDIMIAFVAIDGKGGVVGGSDTNYSAHVGRIFLDSDELWVLPSENITEEAVDLESVVMHQVGHVLGLGHSSREEAVMYPITLPKKKTELANNDDLHRIQEIYNTNSNNNNSSSSNGPTSVPDWAMAPSSQNHLHGPTGSNGVDPRCGWRCNIVLGLAGGFAFMVLGFF